MAEPTTIQPGKTQTNKAQPGTAQPGKASGAPRPRAVISLSEVVPDIMLKVDQVPEPGGYAVAGAPHVAIAAGYRVMKAVANMGAVAKHGGILGNGPLASMIHVAFDEASIAHIGQDRLDEDSGFRIMLGDAAGAKTLIAAYGAEAHGSEDAFDGIEPDPGDVVHISGNTLTNQTAVGLYRFLARPGNEAGERRFRIVLNPTSALPQVSDQLLEALVLARPVWSCNRQQADVLAKRLGIAPLDPRKITVGGDSGAAMSDLAKRLGDVLGAPIVIRSGAKGAWVRDIAPDGSKRDVAYVPGFPTEAVHTRSAGSCHTGVICARLTCGDSLVDAVRLANAAASLAILHNVRGVPVCPSYAEAAALMRKA
ncbi:PfkB family carbohydrate kinase [Bifidobacterium avesanii]|uniref:Sugar kinase n=1 Tax=Bifidobacterium avesanii TaxID=1798157 RepID=A0A7K3TJK9_9BIFI|nr:PfkB family carbohydrate kinase [Bifidobacterium avesanii]KAB8291034.1 sugar kinase [Bifidobacterium avesanii]NEG78800.1 sugar kinase [Bifidobacterium avesanii]